MTARARIDVGFGRLLAPHFRLDALDRHPDTVFGLWPDARLAYFNEPWSAFAAANGGQPSVECAWGLGARYLDAIAEPLRPFYADLLARTPDPGTALHPVSHEYECSSATVFRKFRMQTYALADRAGFIVINSLVVEAPHDPVVRPPQAAVLGRYLDGRGVLVQCAHCRRVQRGADTVSWDWVPEWAERSPPLTSHGVCPICFDYYYPEPVPA